MAGRAAVAGWLLPLMPALLAGAQVAGILFFLNPELAFEALPFTRATLWATALLAPPSYLAHRLVARWRGIAVGRLLPWSLTLVAVASAAGDAVHASTFAFLLPEAMNRQLIKTALWMTLAAVLIFYTALLHTLHHRRYGARSRWLIAIAVVGGIFAMLDRRTSYRPVALDATGVAVAVPADAPRLVLVALPTATLDAVLPLARQGRLPFFARVLESGAVARLETVPSAPPVALWTSWATGKLPFRHGIVGPERFSAPHIARGARLALLPIAPGFAGWGLPGSVGLPLAASDRRALAAWEIFDRIGRPATAFDFPDWLGGSKRAAGARLEEGAGVPSLAERELATLGQNRDVVAARSLAGDRQRLERLRRVAMAAPPATLSAALLPGFEQIAKELYGGFAAARFEGKRSGATTRAAETYEIYLVGLDAELALLWDALTPPRLLVVSSAYGIAAPTGLGRLARALSTSELELAGTLAGGPEGMMLAIGEGILAGARIAEAQVVDLAPTLLYAAGAPIARDLDGRVLTELFEPAILQRRALSFVPSFEGVEAGRQSVEPAPGGG